MAVFLMSIAAIFIVSVLTILLLVLRAPLLDDTAVDTRSGASPVPLARRKRSTVASV